MPKLLIIIVCLFVISSVYADGTIVDMHSLDNKTQRVINNWQTLRGLKNKNKTPAEMVAKMKVPDVLEIFSEQSYKMTITESMQLRLDKIEVIPSGDLK